MLAAWRAEIEAEPIPELVDLDTAVAAVVAGMKADAAGTRRRRADRLRHLAPLAAAAAIIVATISGVGLGSQDAMPGDTLWAIQKVVDPERAESVETKIEVESRLQMVRVALATGDTDTAARELEAIRTEIPAVRGEEGQPQLLQEQEFLTLKLAETPPGTPADLTTPPKSKPNARSTTVAGRAAAAGRPRPPIRRSWSVAPGDPSVSQPVDPDPRTPQRGAGSGARASESGSEGPTTPGLGLVRAGGHQGADRVGAGEHGGWRGRDHRARPVRDDQPASEGGASEPASDGAQGGRPPGTDTTASGSAGTSIDATGTATTS